MPRAATPAGSAQTRNKDNAVSRFFAAVGPADGDRARLTLRGVESVEIRLEVSCIPMAPKLEVNSGNCQPPSANGFAVNRQLLEFVKEKALSGKPPRA